MISYENLGKLNESFQKDFENSFSAVLKKGWFILGEEGSKFEAEFATYCGTNHCVGLANGLDALIIALKSLNLPQGSEVIVPSNTYIATILSIVQCGLLPVLVEPDICTYNIDPLRIEEKISNRTSCIMVVHLYGKMCAMNEITKLAEKHSLAIVEDCAQAHGASLNGIKAGCWGNINAFSFYPTKNLGALGDGGAITTNDNSLAAFTRTYRNYGSRVKYHNELPGVNSRLDEIQAAFLNIKLKRLEEINDHKKALAKMYFEGLSSKQDFVLPVLQEGYNDVYHIFNIRHPHRDQLREFLLKNGVNTEIHYPVSPVNQSALKELFAGVATPIADEIHATTLSLPISFCHSTDDVSRVIDVINEF